MYKKTQYDSYSQRVIYLNRLRVLRRHGHVQYKVKRFNHKYVWNALKGLNYNVGRFGDNNTLH